MAGVQLSLILEKINSRDKDFRYMATSDLANELAKPNFHFGSMPWEEQVTTAILAQLDDQASDISSLATKCLGLLVNKVSQDGLKRITTSLLETMTSAKKAHQREVACLSLKTIIVEVDATRAAAMAATAATPLISALQSPTNDVASNAFDVLIEIISRHGAVFPGHDALRAALLAELDKTKSGARKRAIHCLALSACHLPNESLDILAADILSRVQAEVGGPRSGTYVQALGALSRSVGFKLGPYMSTAIPAIFTILRNATEGEDELIELCIAGMESFVQRSPSQCREYLDTLLPVCLKYLKFDPNYEDSCADEDMQAGSGEEEDEDGLEEDEEESYSDDEDMSWKVRRGAAKLAGAIIVQYPDVLHDIYRQLAPALVARFKEREDAVRPEVYEAYNDIVRESGAAARRGDKYAAEALSNDVPGVMRAIARQLRGKSSTKNKALALKTLQELVRAAPAAVAAGMKDVVPGVRSALEDASTGVSTLKLEALHFVNAALALNPPAAMQPYAVALATPIFAAASDRYYAVCVESLRGCELLVPVLRPVSLEPVNDAMMPLIQPLFEAAIGRLTAQEQGQEVKEAAISCAAAAVAFLGDVFGGESATVGSLAEEFAAMPKSRGRAKKRVKVEVEGVVGNVGGLGSTGTAEIVNILGERLRNEITRLTAVRAFATIARSPLPLDLSPALPQVYPELTSFLRKANRQLRAAALAALTALTSRHGARIDPSSLEAAVMEASSLISDADVAIAAAALRLVQTIVKEQTRVAGAVCQHILPPAVALLKSPLIQGSVLSALQDLLISLVQAGAPSASFDTLFAQLRVVGAAEDCNATAALSAARCAAVLCRAAGQEKVESTADGLMLVLDPSGPGEGDGVRRFALLCVGELGKGSDLSSHAALPATLTSALSSENIAEAASLALGGVASGNLSLYLPLLLHHVGGSAGNPKLQYRMLRALNEVISTTATAHSEDQGQRHSGKMTPQQVAETLQLLSASSAEEEEECRAVVAECLGHLALLSPGNVLPSLRSQLSAAAPYPRSVAVTALKHAAVEREHGIDAALAEVLPEALARISDADVNVRRSAVMLLSAAAHNKPALVLPSLPEALPLLYAQTAPDPALIRTVDLGPFKHKIDDGLELRKASFECLGVLMSRCYAALDSNALLAAIVRGMSDVYDVKMRCHSLLAGLAGLAPGAVASNVDHFVEPLTATLHAKIKADAVKQEVDRNEDMLRSALRAVDALARLPGASGVASFKAFMETVVNVGPMKDRYAAIAAERKAAEGRGAGASYLGGNGPEAMDVA